MMGMFSARAALLLVIGASLAACAGPEEGGSDGLGTSSEVEETGPLEAPILEEVIAVAKVLSVRWSLPSRCDQVDAERRTNEAEFEPAFTAAGTDTEYVDEGANADATYTYRLRCLRGDEASDFSNTLSGNPLAP